MDPSTTGSTERDELLYRDNLLVLYLYTDGAHWGNIDKKWDKDTNLENWYGVTVKPGGVAILRLSNNNLRGTLPPEIWQMSELEEIWMDDNSLSGEIPKLEECQLEKLHFLDLSGNKLTGPLPDFRLLPNLIHLYLGRNNLSGPIPAELGECGGLWLLDLSDNKLEGKIPPSFRHLKKLEHLELNGNTGLKGRPMDTLVNMTSLKEVILHGCSFSGNLPPQLSQLANLEKLILTSNEFSGEIPKAMTKMGKLKEFKVDGETGLSLPENAWNLRSEFFLWMMRIGIVEYMQEVFPPYRSGAPAVSGNASLFPEKGGQRGLLEGPISDRKQDHLGFGDYAEVLVRRLSDPAVWPVGVGIYAQWGAGKSSLVERIIEGLKREGVQAASREPCFCRCLWMSAAGAVVAALCRGLANALSRCCRRKQESSQKPSGGECGRREKKDVTSVVAKFDAWLYADSNALWALLISEIFEQVENHHCFGTGAVRATRVQHAIASSTGMEWCYVIVTALIVAGIGVAAGLAGEKIGDLEQHLEQTVAGIALAGVPIAILLWMVKMLPLVFIGQGQLILSKAKSMGESVGAAHVGFMAEVREEMKVLLGMLKDKSDSDSNEYCLVVCIDNLDRCPHRQIVKVLEAVHLLLEFAKANVAVILALDPRVIIAAIEQDMGEGMRREVSGTEYLDKIIHWPFCIPFGTEEERMNLLDDWLSPKTSTAASAAEPGQGSGGQPPLGPTVGSASGDEDSRGGASSTTGKPHPSDQPAAADAVPPAPGGEEKGSASASPAAEPRQTCRWQPPLGPTVGRSTNDDGNSSEGASCTAGIPPSSDPSAAVDAIPPAPGGEEKANESAVPGTEPRHTSGRQHAPSLDGAVQQGLVRQTSSQLHTAEEIIELKTMIKALKTTPRKAKRVLNIYGIQRDLAIKRAKRRRDANKDNRVTDKNADFARIDAKKLLRWTILSEFWPFHTACLLAVVRDQPVTVRLADLFDDAGTKFIDSVLNGKRSTNPPGESVMDSNNFSRATAGRRLMGMDEADEGFLQVLGSNPPLLVEDFDEDKLGLLRLSFNLNPAMVATVTAWRRALW